MIDLIILVGSIIIISLFCIGFLFALIIMSQPMTELEQAYEDEEQMKYIREYKLKKQRKKENRRRFLNNIKSKIKKFITRFFS